MTHAIKRKNFKLFKANKTRQPSPRIQLTLLLYDEIISHILKHQYDEIFKAILKTKKRKPLNEILILILNIESLLKTDNIVGLHLVILRSEYVPEIIMFQETRGSKIFIPEYERHDGHFLRTEKDRPIQGVTTLTLKQVSNDGIKLLSVKVEPSSFFFKSVRSKYHKIRAIIISNSEGFEDKNKQRADCPPTGGRRLFIYKFMY